MRLSERFTWNINSVIHRNAGGGTRTRDILLKRQALYQLSYAGTGGYPTSHG